MMKSAACALFVLCALALAQTNAAGVDGTAGADANAGVAADSGTDTTVNINININIDTLTAAAPERRKNELTDTVYYESDFIDYNNEERILHLYGKAQVKYQNIVLQADTIVYTVSNDQFQARGAPQLVDGKDTTVGDFMVYNIKTRRGRVSYAVTRMDETFVTGNSVVKTAENCLYIEHGDYTTCDNPEHPHYFFYGRHIKMVPQDKVVSRPVVLNVGDAPVALLPYFILPLQTGRRSGWLTPSWGGSLNHGGYIDNLGYYFAPSDYYDLTLKTKVQEFNSFVFNAAGRYNLRYKLEGQVSGRYVVDNRLENSSQQWALDYRHRQNLTPDAKTTLSGTGSILSSRTFNQLYSDVTNELEQQQMNANMSLSHRLSSINASANAVWRRSHNLTTDRVTEDIPSLDFNLQNRAFVPFKPGGGRSEPSWYNSVYYSYNTRANVRRDAYGSDSLPGFIKPGMEHNVNLNSSQKILKYLDISPYFNIRSAMFLGAIDTLVKDTLYIRDTLVYRVKDPLNDMTAPYYQTISIVPEYFINANGDIDTVFTVTKVSPVRQHLVRDTLDGEFNAVNSWNTGVNMSTRIYGMFPVGVMGVTAVRHTMTPTVGYAFVPKHELDRTFYNVGINYDRPRPKASQLVNFSLSNQFQGKRVVRAGDKGGKRENKKAGGLDMISGMDVSGSESSGERGGDGRIGGDGVFSKDMSGGDDGIGTDNGISTDEDGISIDNNIGADEDGIGTDGSISMDKDSISTDKDKAVADKDSVSTDKNISMDKDSVSTNKDKAVNTKKEEKFDILSLSLNTSYDFEAEERKWRDLSLNAGTNVSFLNVSFSSRFWLYDSEGELAAPIMRDYSFNLTSGKLSASGRFWDGDLFGLDVVKPGSIPAAKQPGGGGVGAQRWDAGVSPSYSYRAYRSTPEDRFQPTKSFNLSASAGVQLTKAISARWNGNYDFSSNRFSHNNYTFYCDLECWEMRFTWRPEKINPGFHFIVNIKKLPDIKWEEKESNTTRVL